MLVISRDESDAIGGALDLIKRTPAARVILPRDAWASPARLELEQYLAAHAVPYETPRQLCSLVGPGDIRWQLGDDGPDATLPAEAHTSLCVRLTLPGTRVLFVAAHSGHALQTLQNKYSAGELEAEIVRLSSTERWPAPVAAFLQQTGCRTVIAGENCDAREIPGFDLNTFAQGRSLRLISPRTDGSLRIQADTASANETLQTFRGGFWQALP